VKNSRNNYFSPDRKRKENLITFVTPKNYNKMTEIIATIQITESINDACWPSGLFTVGEVINDVQLLKEGKYMVAEVYKNGKRCVLAPSDFIVIKSK